MEKISKRDYKLWLMLYYRPTMSGCENKTCKGPTLKVYTILGVF